MTNLLNKEYKITKTLANGSKKTVMAVWAYGIVGNTIQTVKVVGGKKTAKAQNYTIKDFKTGLRLGAVVEI